MTGLTAILALNLVVFVLIMCWPTRSCVVRVMVMIEDEGDGFDPRPVDAGDHFGLLGIKERADFLAFAGRMRLAPQPHDLGRLVEELSDFFHPQCDRAGVVLPIWPNDQRAWSHAPVLPRVF